MFVISSFYGCSQDDNNINTDSQTRQPQITAIDIIKKQYEEKTALLAAKYNLTSSTVDNIIEEYLAIHDPVNSLFRQGFLEKTDRSDFTTFKGESLSQTLNRLSIKNKVPKNIIASLLVDYKIWLECENAAINRD